MEETRVDAAKILLSKKPTINSHTFVLRIWCQSLLETGGYTKQVFHFGLILFFWECGRGCCEVEEWPWMSTLKKDSLLCSPEDNRMPIWFMSPPSLSATLNSTLEQGLLGGLDKPLVFFIDKSSFTTINLLKKRSIFIWIVHISAEGNNITMVSVQGKCGKISLLSLHSQGYRRKRITPHQV